MVDMTKYSIFLGFATAMVRSMCPLDDKHGKFNVRQFSIDLSEDVPRMLGKVRDTLLPDKDLCPTPCSTQGIGLDMLQKLRDEWLTEFDWEREQASLNRFNHFKADIEGLTVHFIHEKSTHPDAIPLLLNHGWPGSFLEFMPIIRNLTQVAQTSSGVPVAFDVIVPSIPGFGFSSSPPTNRTTSDTARVYNTLMTDVLKYKTFATHGTDWGSSISYILYGSHANTTRAAHLSFLPIFALTPAQLTSENITLNSDLEKFEAQRYLEWAETGEGYFLQQTTKPNTIGLALQDDPVGQLAWIGEKLIDWSDPWAGTGHSKLNHNEILRSVSLYYLTRTFTSAIYIYYQNPNGFGSEYRKAETDAPMLFSAFKYNVAFWPEKLVEKVGSLVYYKNHDFGGHFAGVDNPPALLEDLREIRTYWKS